MSITREDVLRVATLARIELTEEDVISATEALGAVLDYVARLDELELTDTEPTFHAHGLSQPLRDDNTTPGLSIESALSNAPDSDGTHFVVPKVV